MLMDTPYWSKLPKVKTNFTKTVGVTANLTKKPLTNTIALSPIQVSRLPAIRDSSRPPLVELSPNVQKSIVKSDAVPISSNASSSGSETIPEVGQFHRGNSGLYRLRHSLMERARKRREAEDVSKNTPKLEVDSGVIDLTQDSDEEKENEDQATTTLANKKYVSGAPISQFVPTSPKTPLVPWKLGPVPDLLYSSRFIDGEPMDSYARLKAKVTAILGPKQPVAVPPCPEFNLSEAENFELEHVIRPKLPKLSLPISQPSTSGLSKLIESPKAVTKPFALSDLDSDDDDKPIESLLPSRDRLNASSLTRTSSRSLSSGKRLDDPCVRKDGCRKRRHK